MEFTDACDFSAVLLPDDFKREASAVSESYHLDSGGPSNSLPVSSTACSSKIGGYALESSLSLEELDALEADLELIHDFLTEESNVGSIGLGEIGLGQDSSKLGKTLGVAENLRDKAYTVKQEANIATVPVDLIQNRRPFKCSHSGCQKTFKNAQTLKMHYKTHSSDEIALHLSSETISQSYRAGQSKKIPCRCPVCGGTFVGLYELRRHFGRKHSEGEKTHRCWKCAKRFYIEVDLRDHLKLCGEPVGCKCGMKFAFRCNLLAHRKAHPECLKPILTPEFTGFGNRKHFSESRMGCHASPDLSMPATKVVDDIDCIRRIGRNCCWQVSEAPGFNPT
ncbi:unnamed protein product [Victoria cruziana]